MVVCSQREKEMRGGEVTIRNTVLGAGKMAQQFRGFGAVVEDLGPILIHIK